MKPRRQDLWRRLIEATLSSIALRGYPATTVRHITDHAGVSRTQFYFLFQDKEECFLAVQNAAIGELESRLREPDYDGLDWPEQMRAGVDAVVSAFDEEPAIARLLLIESAVAGPDAQEQHRQTVARLIPYIERGRELTPSSRELPASVGEMAVGSAAAILTKELRDRPSPSFAELAPQILFAVAMPYIGPVEALERARAAYPEAPDPVTV